MRTARVAGLWRYPVKSLQGAAAETVQVTSRGVVGDREWAFADAASGAVLSAKREPALLSMTAGWDGESVVVSVPGHEPVAGRAAEALAAEVVGRRVVLVPCAADGPAHVDLAPLHLLAVADLDELAAGDPQRAWSPRRFRANVVLDGLDAGDLDGAVGDRVTAGPVALDLMKRTKRCGMVSAAQPGLAKDAGVLRRLASVRDLRLGVYASVATTGRLQVCDPVVVPLASPIG